MVTLDWLVLSPNMAEFHNVMELDSDFFGPKGPPFCFSHYFTVRMMLLTGKKMADLRVGWKHVLKKGGRVVDSDWPRVGQWQSILAAPAPLVLLVVSSGRGGAARTALDQLHHQQQWWAARTALLTTWSPRSSRSPPPSLLDHRQRPAVCASCCFLINKPGSDFAAGVVLLILIIND